ncbi:hypothetical protein [Pedobacter antarcticus]|uniref:hypothetical protein n=1 Tax=Pedobacter antarcticus TaxID=34086 RepID=UPI0029309B40|nr:hypothetical protein [Pedobacter antarcticus]
MMEDWDNLMQYAVSLEFNAPQEPNQVAVIGIAFANSSYCKDAYFLLKNHLEDEKISAEIEIKGISLLLNIKTQSGEDVLRASLNYDDTYLKEFIKLWPSGQSIALIFGAKRNCDFYVINPEPISNEFQPFILSSYELK